MRVLVCGDSPTVSTGFSRCTRALCDALYAAGHSVSIVGINESGDAVSTSSYHSPIYVPYLPRDGCVDLFGSGRTAVLAATLSPDVIVLLNDPWNVPSYLADLATIHADHPDFTPPPVVGWLAVDACNQPTARHLNSLAHVVVWTDFAADELRLGGYTGDMTVVPLGIDTALFSPLTADERTAARARFLPPTPELQSPSAFIVGVVGRNQPRKRLDLTLSYFAEWTRYYSIPDAFLYLHVAPTGDRSTDITSLVRYYGLQGRVLLGKMGKQPIGLGLTSADLSSVYSCFDVYLSTTQGEGWGLPAMEAMACGVPCILPDFAAFGPRGWVGEAAYRVPCTSTALSAPLNGAAYTIGAIPDRDATVDALNFLYNDRDRRLELGILGRSLVRDDRFRWPTIGARICSIVEQVAARRLPAEQVGQRERRVAQSEVSTAAPVPAPVSAPDLAD